MLSNKESQTLHDAGAKIFELWTALNIGIQNYDHGEQAAYRKAREMLDEVLNLSVKQAKRKAVDDLNAVDKIEDFLFDSLKDNFSVEVEDDSCLEVARALYQVTHSILSGDLQLHEQIMQLTKPAGENVAICQDEEFDGFDECSEDEPEDDGWNPESGEFI